MQVQEISENRIWKYRKKQGMGQKRVAYLLGFSTYTHCCEWERGTKVPNLRNAMKLAYILDISIESLFADLYREAAKEVDEKQRKYSEEVKGREVVNF